ncbi:MAG: SPOR domain-containing protein [Burkholderiales bacterium]|nr:SPOR domain-containing protein [Burkholderiales bacterium]
MRRARRRLIGAIALVLAAVIALPMIFDSERKSVDGEVSIHIPSQDVLPAKPPGAAAVKPGATEPQPRDSGPAPKPPEIPKPVAPKVEAAPPPPQRGAEAPAKGTATAKPEAPRKPEATAKGDAAKSAATPSAAAAKPEAKGAPPAKSDAQRAAAILEGRTSPEGAGFAVQVGAFSTEDKLREARDKLQAAGFRTYTEKVATREGERTRVRAGPFAARDAAEAARDRIRELGFGTATVIAPESTRP